MTVDKGKDPRVPESEVSESDDGRQATISMTDGNYQAQIDAVEAEREREIINRNRQQVEDRRRARYEQQDTTNAFDKKEIESERKDLSYGSRSSTQEFMGGSGITTFNDIRYPSPKETKVAAKTPVSFSDNYIQPSATPPAYNPGSYSILGKNYIGGGGVKSSKKQRTTVQEDARKFMATPEYKTLYAQHKEQAIHQGQIYDFMNPSQDKVSEVKNIGTYNPFSGKTDPTNPKKRYKENPESYSILGSKYFSQSKAGATQRKDVQRRAEAFQGTQQYNNRLGMTFTQVAAARSEREKQEALIAKAEGKTNAKVGADSLSQYIPKIGLSGGLSYPIPQTISPRRRDETKQEGGTKAVPQKNRKTGQIMGMRVPASEKKDPPKITDMIKGKGISQEVLQQREESKRRKAAEKAFKESLPPRSPISKLDPIVDAGMGSYFKQRDIAAYTTRKTKQAAEKEIKTRNEALRLERKESLAYSDRESKLQSQAKEASIFNIALASTHGIMATEKQVSQNVESKRQLQQQADAYKNIEKQAGIFARGAAKATEEETKKRAEQERKNPKYLAKRDAARLRQVTTAEKAKETYYNKTPVLNQVTDMLGGGKGTKPYNYNKKHGEGGAFDKTIEQPIFDARGNEIGRTVKKINTFDKFGERHPIMSAFGSHVKREVRRPYDDLLAGRAARADPRTNRGYFYGGGLQPVNITKANPEGEFPKKSGRAVPQRRRDPLGGKELAFFGRPFGVPKPPRRTRSGKVIKMTAAQRKRISRKPKTFLDNVFGAKW